MGNGDCTNVSPPQRGGAVPASLSEVDRNGEKNPEGPDHPIAPNRLEPLNLANKVALGIIRWSRSLGNCLAINPSIAKRCEDAKYKATLRWPDAMLGSFCSSFYVLSRAEGGGNSTFTSRGESFPSFPLSTSTHHQICATEFNANVSIATKMTK